MDRADIVKQLRSITGQLVTLKGSTLTTDEYEAVEEAVRAVVRDTGTDQRDTPVKPIYELTDQGDFPDTFEGYCPVCGNPEPFYEGQPFCDNCGQAIDWNACDITLDEGIEHINQLLRRRDADWECYECKHEHIQLREWLVELKHRRLADNQD